MTHQRRCLLKYPIDDFLPDDILDSVINYEPALRNINRRFRDLHSKSQFAKDKQISELLQVTQSRDASERIANAAKIFRLETKGIETTSDLTREDVINFVLSRRSGICRFLSNRWRNCSRDFRITLPAETQSETTTSTSAGNAFIVPGCQQECWGNALLTEVKTSAFIWHRGIRFRINGQHVWLVVQRAFRSGQLENASGSLIMTVQTVNTMYMTSFAREFSDKFPVANKMVHLEQGVSLLLWLFSDVSNFHAVLAWLSQKASPFWHSSIPDYALIK